MLHFILQSQEVSQAGLERIGLQVPAASRAIATHPNDAGSGTEGPGTGSNTTVVADWVFAKMSANVLSSKMALRTVTDEEPAANPCNVTVTSTPDPLTPTGADVSKDPIAVIVPIELSRVPLKKSSAPPALKKPPLERKTTVTKLELKPMSNCHSERSITLVTETVTVAVSPIRCVSTTMGHIF